MTLHRTQRISAAPRSSRPQVFGLLTLATVAVAFAMITLLWILRDASASWPVTYRDMIRDPVSIGGLTPYHGALSQLGVILMLICAAATGVVATVGVRPLVFGSVMLLSITFALDDLFLFHEYLAAHWLGLAEFHAVLIYPLLTALIFAAMLVQGRLEWVLPLVFCAGLLALSLASDLFAPPGSPFEFLDGAGKLAALASWTLFWLITGVDELRRHGPARNGDDV